MADEFWDDPSWYSSNGYDTNYTSPDITIDTSFTNPDYSWSNLDLGSLLGDLGLGDLGVSGSSFELPSMTSLLNLGSAWPGMTSSSQLMSMDPDQATRMYGQQVGDLVAQAQAEDDALLQAGKSMIPIFGNPINYAPGSLSDKLQYLSGDVHPAQSYVTDSGLTVGLGDGSQYQNPFDYASATQLDQNGDRYSQPYVVNNDTRRVVGFLDENGQPQYYSNLLAENTGSLANPSSSDSASTGGSGGSSSKSALDQIYSKLLAKMNADEAAKKSGLGQAIGAAQMAASLYQALAGKNQGYGVQKRSSTVTDSGPSAQAAKPVRTLYAKGGAIDIPEAKHGALVPMAIELAKAMASSGNHGLIPGSHGGQDDVVDIKAAPGEYIFDAETVSALGDGNTEAGAKRLDEMRRNIREHKRGGALTEIAAQAKSPAEYLPKGKK